MTNYADNFEPSSLVVQQMKIYYVGVFCTGKIRVVKIAHSTSERVL
jgi:hypothetical protein